MTEDLNTIMKPRIERIKRLTADDQGAPEWLIWRGGKLG